MGRASSEHVHKFNIYTVRYFSEIYRACRTHAKMAWIGEGKAEPPTFSIEKVGRVSIRAFPSGHRCLIHKTLDEAAKSRQTRAMRGASCAALRPSIFFGEACHKRKTPPEAGLNSAETEFEFAG